eukprot:m.14093 g.14093  ORF g.14093 m.14093 type:complete len:244 (-) comp10002_c0_seq1:522-1253(-)
MNANTSGKNRRSSMHIVESAHEKPGAMSPDSTAGEQIAKRMLEAVKLAYDTPTNSPRASTVSNGAVMQAAAIATAVPMNTKSVQRQSVSRSSMSSAASAPDETFKLCRIYDADAIRVPGVMYKTVGLSASMSSQDLIKEALGKFGSFVEPKLLELHFAADPERMPVQKKKKKAEPSKVVMDDECPMLVVEWYTDIPRRFEIHLKSADSEKLKKKWTSYWHSPGSFSRSKSVKPSKSVKSKKKH